MNYSYEILKAEPKHKFLSVRYFAEGKDDFFKNFNPENWEAEAITGLIEDHAQFVVAHWDYQETATETSPLSVGDIGTSSATAWTPPPPPGFDDPTQEEMVRQERNYLLRETDWMMFSDTDSPSQAWLDYRQALRDIPEQSGFPTSVTWPTKPA